MAKTIRKFIGLAATIVLYYIIHEGAHLLVSLFMGTFQKVLIARWGLGVQIVVDAAAMSNLQLFIFCIAGAVATLIAGYILVWKRKSIQQSAGKLLRTIAYYTTLAFLCLDPLYLSLFYRFVGGGDMNGILLLGIPELAVSIFFFIILALNVFIFIRFVLPSYKQSFLSDNK